MTIRVTIRNEEPFTTDGSGRTLLVSTLAYEKGKHGERVMQQQRIQPGQSAEFHVHLLTDLHVEELAE